MRFHCFWTDLTAPHHTVDRVERWWTEEGARVKVFHQGLSSGLATAYVIICHCHHQVPPDCSASLHLCLVHSLSLSLSTSYTRCVTWHNFLAARHAIGLQKAPISTPSPINLQWPTSSKYDPTISFIKARNPLMRPECPRRQSLPKSSLAGSHAFTTREPLADTSDSNYSIASRWDSKTGIGSPKQPAR